MFGQLGVRFWHVRKAARMAGDLHTFRVLRTARVGAEVVSGQTDVLTIRLNGVSLRIRVRPGTFDVNLIKSILCAGSEYELPVKVNPQVIVDAGANIGITALYFAALFPQARIFCFEPLPANLELLRENTAPWSDRIVIVPKGLSDHSGLLDFHSSTNPVDFSAGGFGTWGNATVTQQLAVTTLDDVLREHGVTKLDVMKLDIEGSEGPALRGTSPGMLETTDVVVGELHNVEDWAVLDLLMRTHRVGYKRVYWNDCTSFVAVNKKLVV